MAPILKLQKVTDLASEGFGVIRAEGHPAILVPFTVEDEIVDIALIRRKRQVWYAEALKWHQESPHRVSPSCGDFGMCGGCRWQMMDYFHQLYHKRRFVEQNLHHIAKLSVPVPAVKPSPHIWHYRNKAEYTFGSDPEKGIQLGFHPRGDFATVIGITQCQLVPPVFEQIRKAVMDQARALSLPPYDPKRHTGLLRQLIVRGTSEQLVVLLSLAEDRPEIAESLLAPLWETIPSLKGTGYFFNPKRNESMHDLFPVLLQGDLHLTFSLAGRTYLVGPKDFFQVNLAQAENMISWIRSRLPETVPVMYDLYGGVGLFGVALADIAEEVVLVEKLPEAVRSAQKNFENNQIFFPKTKWSMFEGALEKLWKAPLGLSQKSTAIIDPPREGLHPRVRRTLLQLPVENLFYVSCHPATQARDLIELQERYTIIEVQPFDLFPHTTAVENIAWLQRKN
ncbi:MAG: 23S rRNA (uracil(1939)-C(5))-methyltransferase RlmD [Bacteroidia bacterium]|nr:23S rRNA (uracil(1939)-C(5))-methyltransferase RlmD [Bacteroidia bacterium]